MLSWMEYTWADIMKRCRITYITQRLCWVPCKSAAPQSVPDDHRVNAPRSRYARRGERLEAGDSAARFAQAVFWLQVFPASKQRPVRPGTNTPLRAWSGKRILFYIMSR